MSKTYINKKYGVKLVVHDEYLQYANISLTSPRKGNYNGMVNSDYVKKIIKTLNLTKQ